MTLMHSWLIRAQTTVFYTLARYRKAPRTDFVLRHSIGKRTTSWQRCQN